MDGEHAPVPAIGASVVCDIGPGRQLTLQTHFGLEEEPSAQHAVLDRLNALATRSRAPFDIERIEEEVRTHRQALERMDEDAKRVEADFAQKQSKRGEAVAQLEQARDGVMDQGLAGWKGRGQWEPKGNERTRIQAANTAIEGHKADMAMDAEQKAVAIRDLSVQRKRFNDEIARLEERLAKLRALLEG